MAEINANDFDKYKATDAVSQEIDIPFGDSEFVLGMASFQNIGKAIVDNDLYPPGEYLLHKFPGAYSVFVVKHDSKNYTFVTNVVDAVYEDWWKGLQRRKDAKQYNESKGDKQEYAWYDVPMWIVTELMLNVGVHPAHDEAAFEQALWDYFPNCWISPEHAPRRIIGG